jgi:hypothetical protein
LSNIYLEKIKKLCDSRDKKRKEKKICSTATSLKASDEEEKDGR